MCRKNVRVKKGRALLLTISVEKRVESTAAAQKKALE